MEIKRKFFGTNGIRGILGVNLTLEFIINISRAIATYFDKSPILIGFDGRLSSPLIAKAVSTGIMVTGIDVLEAGLIPTPCLQYIVKKRRYCGGIMITASHNPPQYNGIKVVGNNGVEISRECEAEIEKIFLNKKYKKANCQNFGKCSNENNVIETYINDILSQVDTNSIKKNTFKVVLDLGNSVASLTVPCALSRMGCKILTINEHIDGNFPGRGSEPIPSKLFDLSNLVISSKADIGIAYDGDGDRAIFCDEKGIIYWGDVTGTFLVDYLLKKFQNSQVITTVSTSQMLDYIVEKRKGKIVKTRVGSVEVSKAMIENNALLGLEENGGFFYAPHIPVRDGLMTTALVLEALSKYQKPFSTILSELPKFYQRKTKFECPNTIKNKIIKEIKRKTKGKIESIDGIKIWIDQDTWILIRSSGTEPLIRFFCESKDEKKLDELITKYSKIIKDIIKNKQSYK